MSTINIETIERHEKVEIPEKLIFGRTFTDHVFELDYDSALGGWHNPIIKKISNISLSPAAMVFHYGQEIFEGLKAYKQDDGRIALFRPEKNFERLNNSARRLCIPEMNADLLMEALLELIRIDKDWIPTQPGHSLYTSRCICNRSFPRS